MSETAPHPDGLLTGERVLAEWRPSPHVFWRKLFTWGVISALIFFAGAAGFGLPLLAWLIGFPLSVAAFILAFGDYQEWGERRHDRWLLTDRRLIFRNQAEPGGGGAIQLDQIDRLRMGLWTLTLRLRDRQVITMSYLPDLAEVRETIRDTSARADGGAHG